MPVVLIVILSVVAFILLLIVVCNIRIVKQTDKYIIERLGAYRTTWGSNVMGSVRSYTAVVK